MKMGMAQTTARQLDVARGTVRFVNASGSGLEGRGQLLGSYEAGSGTWEWAWNQADCAAGGLNVGEHGDGERSS